MLVIISPVALNTQYKDPNRDKSLFHVGAFLMMNVPTWWYNLDVSLAGDIIIFGMQVKYRGPKQWGWQWMIISTIMRFIVLALSNLIIALHTNRKFTWNVSLWV